MEESMRKIALALVLGSLAFAPRLAAAQTHEKYLEELAIEGADTPAKHEALAAHYRAKAADARAEAKRHEAMASSYGRMAKPVQKGMMQDHCTKLAEDAKDEATQYDSLAKAHEDEAKKK
jgi:hypothetical protein